MVCGCTSLGDKGGRRLHSLTSHISIGTVTSSLSRTNSDTETTPDCHLLDLCLAQTLDTDTTLVCFSLSESFANLSVLFEIMCLYCLKSSAFLTIHTDPFCFCFFVFFNLSVGKQFLDCLILLLGPRPGVQRNLWTTTLRSLLVYNAHPSGNVNQISYWPSTRKNRVTVPRCFPTSDPN